MSTQQVRGSGWPVASFGMASILVAAGFLTAQAQKPSGVCANDGTQGCLECANMQAQTTSSGESGPRTMMTVKVGCTGPESVPSGYGEGTCDDSDSSYCSETTVDCGDLQNCITGKIVGTCNQADYCSNTVLV